MMALVVWELMLLLCGSYFSTEYSASPLSELVYGSDMLALLHFVLSDLGYFRNTKLTISLQCI